MTDADNALMAVTADQWAIIRPDLEQLLKVQLKRGEDLQPFAVRLAKLANDPKKVSDDAWQKLNEMTQKWVNGAQICLEKGDPVPIPEESDNKEEGETVATATTKTKSAGKAAAPAKAKATAKPPAAAKATDKGNGKAKTAAPAAAASGRGRPARFADDAKIKILTQNPHRPGSKDYHRFEVYKEGMTVAKALATAITADGEKHVLRRTDLNWHVDHGNIAVA